MVIAIRCAPDPHKLVEQGDANTQALGFVLARSLVFHLGQRREPGNRLFIVLRVDGIRLRL